MLICGVELYIVVGWIAVILGNVTAIPQVWKSWRTGSSNDLSIGMISLVILAQFCWFGYGYGIRDNILMISAVAPFVWYSILTCIYYKNKNKRPQYNELFDP